MAGLWASLVDLAVTEQVVAPTNAAAVPVHSANATFLRGVFARVDDPDEVPIPMGRVRCEPVGLPAMPPGHTMWVVVHIDPGEQPDPPVMQDQGYVGVLVDDHGTVLTEVPVYVPVHVPWAS
jgi:hypothetical protein